MTVIMQKENEYWLDILKHNKGFTSPEEWVDYARTHNFQKIKAKKLLCCPDCGCNIFSAIGQYIYYSTLITLQYCENCGLIFSDTHIDPIVIAKHFENSYKDDLYFIKQRKLIFEYLTCLVQKYCPPKGRILDVGGGKGHLLALINKHCPNLYLTLNDLSQHSCNYATKHYGLKTICKAISDIPLQGNGFNLILLIDVIYYEPDVNKMWDVVGSLLSSSGMLIIRIPNKLEMIRGGIIVSEIIRKNRNTIKQKSSIKFFNPEHIYIFSKSHLRNRLKKMGFDKITVTPSPPLMAKSRMGILCKLYFRISMLIYRLTFNKVILTPSCFVLARKH